MDLHLQLLADALQILVIPQGTFQRLLGLQGEQMVFDNKRETACALQDSDT